MKFWFFTGVHSIGGQQMRLTEIGDQLSADRRGAGLLQGAGQSGSLSDERQTKSGTGRDVSGSNEAHDRVPATEHANSEHHIVCFRQPYPAIDRRGGNQYGRTIGCEEMQLLDRHCLVDTAQ